MGVVCCLGAGLEEHDLFFEARPGEMRLATVTEQGSVKHLCRESRNTTVSETRRRWVWPIHTFREHGPLSGVQLDMKGFMGGISGLSSV